MAEYDDYNINQNSSKQDDSISENKVNDNDVINNNLDETDHESNRVNNNVSNNVSNNVNNSQNQNNKVPEYNFWAEQVPNGSYNSNPNRNTSYNNPSYNYQDSQYQNNAYQYSNQNNSSQNNSSQNNSYQNNSYQNNSYQNNGYQGNGYQGNGYPNNGYPNNTYPNNNQNSYQSNSYPNYNYQNNPYPNSAYQNYKRPEKKKGAKPVGKVFRFLGKAVCFGLIAGLGFFGFQQVYYAINPDAKSSFIINTASKDTSYEIGYTEPGVIETADKSVITNVTNNTLPSIVSINMVGTQQTQWFGQNYDQQVEGSGSGIIVGEDDKELLIATNNHVVEGAEKISVTFADGTQADAIIKGTDSTADLAVVTVDISTLKDDTLKAIKVAKLGNSDDVQVGEMVIAIGNALGYGQSVTVGYVSAKDREVEITDTTGYNTKKMILLQTDAAINPGNSGGALINIKGEVIGINTVKYASSEVEGMGYAIPISKATPIINELMTREVLSASEKGYLGIAGTDVTEDVASFYNMPVGVYVQEVSAGGAAEKAGLKADDIITGADDLEITSITQLKEYVNSLRVGTEVKIKYMRNTNGQYEEETVTVTLGQNPNLNAAD